MRVIEARLQRRVWDNEYHYLSVALWSLNGSYDWPDLMNMLGGKFRTLPDRHDFRLLLRWALQEQVEEDLRAGN